MGRVGGGGGWGGISKFMNLRAVLDRSNIPSN